MPNLTKAQALSGSKKINKEANKLNPSTIVTFYEIDLSDVLFENGVTSVSSSNNKQYEQLTIFRFHNNLSLTRGDLVFQGNTFFAMPIQADGFELNGSGPAPTPTLTISTLEEGSAALSLLKCQIASISEMVGAKVTRIRTFAKHIDSINFIGRKPPEGFDPDPNAEFVRQIFYIDRKIEESKLILKYELNTLFDVRGQKLPKRLVLANRCPFSYRGEGCCYEFADNRINGTSRLSTEHDGVLEKYLGRNGYAPPVANVADSKFSDVYGINYFNLTQTELQEYDKGEYDPEKTYGQAEYVYVTKDGINYYFVAKKAVPENTPPTSNSDFWDADQCSKSIHACGLRFGRAALQEDGSFKSTRELPFGGFAGINKISSR